MNDTGSGARAYRNPLSDVGDQVLFSIFLIIGAVSVVAMKWVGINSFIVASVPLGVLFIYGNLGYRAKQFRLREDKLGDNIYYMGFLFTLVSLAYAISVYDPEGAAAASIIQNFGIALSSTIGGVYGRVICNQMREDPVEYEREARFSLSDASNRLRGQLGEISNEMATFKLKIGQIMEEGMRDVAEVAKDAMNDNSRNVKETSEALLQELRDTLKGNFDHSRAITDIGRRGVKSIDLLFKRIDAIEASPDLISSKLEPVISEFQALAKEVSKSSKEQEKATRLAKEMIEGALAAANSLTTVVSGYNDLIAAGSVKMARAVDDASGSAERLSKAAASVAMQIENRAEIAKQTSNALAAQLKEQIDVAKSSAAAFKQSLDAFLYGNKQEMEKIRADFRSDLDTLTEQKAEQKRLVGESAQMLNELEESIKGVSLGIIRHAQEMSTGSTRIIEALDGASTAAERLAAAASSVSGQIGAGLETAQSVSKALGDQFREQVEFSRSAAGEFNHTLNAFIETNKQAIDRVRSHFESDLDLLSGQKALQQRLVADSGRMVEELQQNLVGLVRSVSEAQREQS